MRIIYNNRVDDATATALTANGSFPVTNVQDQRLATVYRSTAVTSQTITLDLGAAYAIDTAAIIAHNFTSSATITVSANSSDSWPGATSQTLTYNANMILKFFTTETYRYWQFAISDATNTDGYLEIGRLWLGAYTTVDPSSLLNFKVIKKRNDVVVHGKGRQKFASEGIGWRAFELDFPATQNSMVETLLTMYDTVGNHSSVIFCNFDTARNHTIVEPCYCSLNGDLEFTHTTDMKFTYRLSLEEEL